MMTDSVKISTSQAEDVKRRLEREKNSYTDHMARRVGLDLKLREVNEDIRHGLDDKSTKEK